MLFWGGKSQKKNLRKGIYGVFLFFCCFMPQVAMSAEPKLMPSIHAYSGDSIPDSILLQEYTNLELDRYNVQMFFYNEFSMSLVKNERMNLDSKFFPVASSSFNLETLNGFTKENILNINHLLLSLHFPPLVQAPEKSSLPDPLSLLMLSIGSVVLLAWSRRKRYI